MKAGLAEPKTADEAETQRASSATVPRPRRRLARDTVVYGLGRVALQLIAAISFPIFTRIFDPAQYGVMATTTTVASVLALAASLGLESASQRSYFDYSDEDRRERQVVLSTTFVAMLLSSTILTAFFIVFARPLSNVFFGTGKFAVPLALGVGALPLSMLSNFTLEVMRLRAQPVRYSIVAFLGGVASTAIALYLAGVRHEGLTGAYLGSLLGSLIGLVVGLVIVRDTLRFAFDRRELRVMLAYGLPLVPVAASTWVLQLADRFFLLHFSTLRELGLYGVANRLSNLLLLAVTAFGLAWSPHVLEFHQRDPEGERAARGRVLTSFTLLLCFGALSMSVYAYEIMRILTPARYLRAYEVVGLLAGAIVAIGINGVTMTEISLKRRTGYFARYTIYAAVVNTALNFAFIPSFGMVGAGIATLVAYALLAWLYYWRAQRLEAAPFEGGRLLVMVAVTAALVAVGTFIRPHELWLGVVEKLPLLVGFFVLLRLFGVLESGWLAGAFARSRDLMPTMKRASDA